MKTIGIAGCGLIGGSFAKAVKTKTDCRVLAFDQNESALCRAELENAIDGRLNAQTLKHCDLVLIALPPHAIVPFLREYAAKFKRNAIVIDCAGVKRTICPEAWRIADANNFLFIGGHPMAGKERSGFERASDALYNNASMLLVFEEIPQLARLEKIKKFFLDLGFARVVTTTPEKHDRLIAYTSQLAHALSASFVKSPTADEHAGFSAGSFRDMIRVASVDPQLWSDLFLDNRDNLQQEIHTLISRLAEFETALKKNDREQLVELFTQGAQRKATIESLRTFRETKGK